jgi:glycosyltransferase involved in cell wall biosynthesis
MPKQIIILCPFYNDSESLNILLGTLHQSLGHLTDHEISILVVNDGSTEPIQIHKQPSFTIKILHLHRNIGHQKALAVGLSYIRDNMEYEKVLVMDTDGEDRPEDALELLYASDRKPGHVIFASRSSRQESSQFKLFYQLYKLSFRILTGRKIAYGNFMIMPRSSLEKIVYYSEIWNHLAGGVLKSGIPFGSVQTHRGKRYTGHSKMNFTRLLMHGLGAIAVFTEVIASRLLVFSFLLIGFSLFVILLLLGIKTFSDLALPGWTSIVISSMLVVLLQSFLLSLFTLFLYFSSESQRKFIPAQHYRDFTGQLETVTE